MYRIDRATNRIQPLKHVSFRELGFRERAHLQEWIAREPMALGEDLLIIQKEFAGFSDTNERLDLLALDKQGSLVIIENKLDDTGRDVTWQALKYASYCSTLSKDEIRKIFQEYLSKCGEGQTAEEALSAFFDDEDYAELALNKGISQRIILVAANFRKEVTSTVLWLNNFRVRVQCFRATPFAMGEELFLNIEQIIPAKDTEEFTIGLADKAKDEVEGLETEARRHPIRRKFWAEVIKAMNATPSHLYQNISPAREAGFRLARACEASDSISRPLPTIAARNCTSIAEARKKTKLSSTASLGIGSPSKVNSATKLIGSAWTQSEPADSSGNKLATCSIRNFGPR